MGGIPQHYHTQNLTPISDAPTRTKRPQQSKKNGCSACLTSTREHHLANDLIGGDTWTTFTSLVRRHGVVRNMNVTRYSTNPTTFVSTTGKSTNVENLVTMPIEPRYGHRSNEHLHVVISPAQACCSLGITGAIMWRNIWRTG